jgi:hypothetical protein
MMEIMSADTKFNGKIYAKTLFMESAGNLEELKCRLRLKLGETIMTDQELPELPAFRVRYGRIKVTVHTAAEMEANSWTRVKVPQTAA